MAQRKRKRWQYGPEDFKRKSGRVNKAEMCFSGWTTIYAPDGNYGSRCAIFAPSIEALRFFWKRMTKLPMKRRHCQRVTYFSERSVSVQPDTSTAEHGK